MTGFENRTFRDLVNIKASELRLTETEEGENLADELQELIRKIYAFQQKNGTDNN